MKNLKGLILAGGNGTRLAPLTTGVNKHLLPISKKPMIQHCVEKMTTAGITEIMVVTGGEHLGGIAEFLGSGERFGCEFTFRVQEAAGGIAQAIGLARHFISRDDNLFVLLGDNIFKEDVSEMVFDYAGMLDQGLEAMIVLKEVDDPCRFGVAVVEEDRVVRVLEKPKVAPSNLAVTGLYFYDHSVFDIISGLKASARGEMEVTDINNAYIQRGKMGYSMMEGWWTDAGTHESYRKANELVIAEEK